MAALTIRSIVVCRHDARSPWCDPVFCE